MQFDAIKGQRGESRLCLSSQAMTSQAPKSNHDIAKGAEAHSAGGGSASEPDRISAPMSLPVGSTVAKLPPAKSMSLANRRRWQIDINGRTLGAICLRRHPLSSNVIGKVKGCSMLAKRGALRRDIGSREDDMGRNVMGWPGLIA